MCLWKKSGCNQQNVNELLNLKVIADFSICLCLLQNGHKKQRITKVEISRNSTDPQQHVSTCRARDTLRGTVVTSREYLFINESRVVEPTVYIYCSWILRVWLKKLLKI